MDTFPEVCHHVYKVDIFGRIFLEYVLPLYSRLSLSRSRRDPLNHFEIAVRRPSRFAELRKIPIELPNFTNEHVI